MPEVLNGELHTKSYSFIKYLLVTNDLGNPFEEKGLLLVGGEGIRCSGACYCRLSRMCVLRDWRPGFRPKEWK